MYVIFRIYFRPIIKHEQKYDQFQIYRKKTNSCWLENNKKVLSNDKADTNNQNLTMHKEFDTIPKFHPIIDTTGTPYYDVGKYLAKLLNPLTTNEFFPKDSFNATTHTQNIPQDLFDKGYKFISFDVESPCSQTCPLQKL